VGGITYEDLLTGVVVATAIDLKSNSNFDLGTRKGSRCLFFDSFMVGEDEVQLRLDWTDIDPSGNPVLDADFYSTATGKRKKALNSNPAHHTSANTLGKRIYEWKYSYAELEILVQVSWNVAVSEDAKATDSSSATVIKGQTE
jgi:hypothetical protein